MDQKIDQKSSKSHRILCYDLFRMYNFHAHGTIFHAMQKPYHKSEIPISKYPLAKDFKKKKERKKKAIN